MRLNYGYNCIYFGQMNGRPFMANSTFGDFRSDGTEDPSFGPFDMAAFCKFVPGPPYVDPMPTPVVPIHVVVPSSPTLPPDVAPQIIPLQTGVGELFEVGTIGPVLPIGPFTMPAANELPLGWIGYPTGNASNPGFVAQPANTPAPWNWNGGPTVGPNWPNLKPPAKTPNGPNVPFSLIGAQLIASNWDQSYIGLLIGTCVEGVPGISLSKHPDAGPLPGSIKIPVGPGGNMITIPPGYYWDGSGVWPQSKLITVTLANIFQYNE